MAHVFQKVPFLSYKMNQASIFPVQEEDQEEEKGGLQRHDSLIWTHNDYKANEHRSEEMYEKM